MESRYTKNAIDIYLLYLLNVVAIVQDGLGDFICFDREGKGECSA